MKQAQEKATIEVLGHNMWKVWSPGSECWYYISEHVCPFMEVEDECPEDEADWTHVVCSCSQHTIGIPSSNANMFVDYCKHIGQLVEEGFIADPDDS